jgi:putative MFS transporter
LRLTGDAVQGRSLLLGISVLAILAGVGAHLPMFVMSAPTYRMASMPMDALMLSGMASIVLGAVGSLLALLPPPMRESERVAQRIDLRSIDDAPLTTAHWLLAAVLMIALIVDVMKPATLGFVVPGMRDEYGLSRDEVALFPLSALIGTTVGSLMWGVLADRIGRRASILLAAVWFMGTSICGTMPTFAWNNVMCFMMGMAAGGLLPIAYTLMAETMPRKHRGWMLVLVGGVGTAGGYWAAAANAAIVEPILTWRGLWFAGVPTGLSLLLLNRWLPESPRFLARMGREAEAKRVLARFGVELRMRDGPPEASATVERGARLRHRLMSLAMFLCAFGWGLANFGFLLWLPQDLRHAGIDPATIRGILSTSAGVSFPAYLLVAWLYQSWSSRRTIFGCTVVEAAVLCVFALLGDGILRSQGALIALIVALLASSAGVIAALVPYASEVFAAGSRAPGTGMVAGASKFGGVIGVLLGASQSASGVGVDAAVAAVPLLFAALLLPRVSVETRGRALDQAGAPAPALEAWAPAASNRDPG